jgi:hypothetical protein
MTIRAPFPWFGGKSRAAHLVWAAFGDVPNYVEPFAGSLAVLLGRPTAPRVETVNDLDCYLANFWRAVKFAPVELAEHADWPVNEADLHARHRWLVAQDEFRARIRREPKYFDVQIAGWWVWGLCQWIGGGWCASSNWGEWNRGAPSDNKTAEQGRRPSLQRGNGIHAGGKRPRGQHTAEEARRPNLHASNGVHRRSLPEKKPMLTGGHGEGVGVNRRRRDLAGSSEWEKRPVLGRGGRGVNLSQQIPNLSGDAGAAGRGIHATGQSNGPLIEWMNTLAARLRRVRVCCGDWTRVLGRSATETIGVTGVMLDPPYNTDAGRDPSLYAVEDLEVSHKVREWALAHGDNPKFRIALCGYEGEHEMPSTWERVEWKANGGYAASAGNHENAKRERIWFSPHCELVTKQLSMFAAEVA